MAWLKEVEALLAAEPDGCWCRYCTKLHVEANALRKGVTAMTAAEARGRQQAEQTHAEETAQLLDHWKGLVGELRDELDQYRGGFQIAAQWGGRQAEQTLDCQTSDGLYHCRHDVLCQACQLRHANERVAALTQALKEIAAHDGDRWDYETGMPEPKPSPQEIAQLALATLTGAQA